ncbi:hypothetical protein MKD49_12140 [Herbaspirillum sp. WGmk3]|uniref:DUF6708 domain-containing protein n=1 Tax=Herbaspirillum sp. WGmk3 TaxID=2919925 RepID=UPI0020918785|nr:DUF6708 domain-containing protein [Herbaspirillum sp. WGmk3]MCO4857229.1 hypothetical protein [Herbaspirillum sp. WGmk3]
MSSTPSRFNPINQHWYEDLPDHQADFGRNLESPTLADDINAISESYLEVSRAGIVIRRGLLMVGTVMLVFFSWVVMHLVAASIGPDDALIFPIISWSLLALGMTCAIFSMILDCSIPRDMPVRFDRDKCKVYAYDYPIRLMPFPPLDAVPTPSVETKDIFLAGRAGRDYQAVRLQRKSLCRPLCAGSCDLSTRHQSSG